MFVLRSSRVVLPDGERAASIHVHDGVIVRVGAYAEIVADAEAIDAGTLAVSPGVVDAHVHLNEPGRTEWEGFDTGTRAAAAGGVTTLVDMPLNSVPATVDVPALASKRAAAMGRCHVNVAFWGGIVPGNAQAIAPLIDAGVRGFKCFLTPSGVEEFPAVAEDDLRRALPELRRAGRSLLPLLVHAEDPTRLREPVGDPRAYPTFLETRPTSAEAAAIRVIAGLAGDYDVPAHIVHVSSGDGVRAVAAAQARGLPLTAETCPHYLTFDAATIAKGATSFKCAPPIRHAVHQAALWDALRDRILSMVVTDHSPVPPSMKQTESGNFLTAWGGIASLELSLAAVWTAARSRGFSTADVASWMSLEPARLAGLAGRKGAIRPGCDADLIVWDPDAPVVVRAGGLQQRHKLTPYDGMILSGAVRDTFVAGIKVWSNGGLVAEGRGHLL